MPHVAHANVARMRAPMGSAAMEAFARAVEPVNLLAERSPGFVWRFRDEDDPEAVRRVFGAEDLLLNLSVWETVDALREFTYASGHAHYVKHRKTWFSAPDGPRYVLWWVAAGHVPSPEESRDRLDHLGACGPTPEAFTFTHPFDPSTA